MPGVPDFRDGIAKWNARWEAHFPVLNPRIGNLRSLVSSCGQFSSAELQQELRTIHSIVRGICRTQEDLRMLAITSVLQPNFCWKTLTPAAREAHMLEGLMRVCLNEPDNTPNTRLYTCDITLASLESGNGEGFLTLLRRYVPEGEVSITEGRCISYLHPGWSEETIESLRSAGKEAQVQAWIAIRDKFLTDFLYNTILSIVGTPRAPEFVYRANGIQTSSLDWGSWSKKPPNKKLNSESSKETPVYRLGKICDGCRRPERDDDPRFMVCKKCIEKTARKVYYCSRDCQMSHWPNHKQICGKELTPAAIQLPSIHTEASLANAVFFLERMGPARDGYTRSPALVRQILYLDATPQRDYVFFSPAGPQPIIIPLFLLRLVLRLTVQTASVTGDPGCIAALSEVVFQCFGYAPTAFLDQFVAEYGDAAASAAKAMQGRTDGSGLFRPAGKLITRWKDQFLRSDAGSHYAKVENEPPEGPSMEITRKVITDLREWWPRRS